MAMDKLMKNGADVFNIVPWKDNNLHAVPGFCNRNTSSISSCKKTLKRLCPWIFLYADSLWIKSANRMVGSGYSWFQSYDRRRVRLGRMLFYDNILSMNGRSCSSCHHPDKSYSTPVFVSNSGESISVPPLINLAWNPGFEWYGQVPKLDHVPLGDFYTWILWSKHGYDCCQNKSTSFVSTVLLKHSE